MGDTATTQIRRCLLRIAERLRHRELDVSGPALAVLQLIATELEAEALGKKPKTKSPPSMP